MASWNEEARTQSAVLLQTLFVYHEENVTERLNKIVQAFCKALRKCRNENYGAKHKDAILECARVLGRYVVPGSFVPFLAPRVSGDLEVLPGGVDADVRGDVADLLAAMLRGAKGSSVLPHVAQLADVLTDPALLAAAGNLRKAGLAAAGSLLRVIVRGGSAALASSFVATGRLESLDAALLALLKAILAWRRGGDRSVADAALFDLAEASGISVGALAATRAPRLFREDDEALEDASTPSSNALREALELAAGPGVGVLLTLAAGVARRAAGRLVVFVPGLDDDERPDPDAEDAARVVSSLAEALAAPTAAARDARSTGGSDDDFAAAAPTILDAVLAPDACWTDETARRARCDLARALVGSDAGGLELSRGARGLVAALLGPATKNNVDDPGLRRAALSGVRAATVVLQKGAGSLRDAKARRKPVLLRNRPDDVAESVHGAARLALDAVDRMLMTGAEALQRAAAELATEIVFTLRPAPDPADSLCDDDDDDAVVSVRLSLSEVVLMLGEHLPSNYPEDYVDNAEAMLDGALRAAAVLDPAVFVETIKTFPRTNVTVGLEDHAEMCASLSSSNR